jgi:hypothetical protein
VALFFLRSFAIVVRGETLAQQEKETLMRYIFAGAILAMLLSAPTAHAEFGAVSVSNDGKGSSAWNYSTADEARNVVVENCKKASSLPDRCKVEVVSGTSWAASVFCENDKWRRGVAAQGLSAKKAIVAAYKTQLAGDDFKKKECMLTKLIAANGAHLKHAKKD